MAAVVSHQGSIVGQLTATSIISQVSLFNEQAMANASTQFMHGLDRMGEIVMGLAGKLCPDGPWGQRAPYQFDGWRPNSSHRANDERPRAASSLNATERTDEELTRLLKGSNPDAVDNEILTQAMNRVAEPDLPLETLNLWAIQLGRRLKSLPSFMPTQSQLDAVLDRFPAQTEQIYSWPGESLAFLAQSIMEKNVDLSLNHASWVQLLKLKAECPSIRIILTIALIHHPNWANELFVALNAREDVFRHRLILFRVLADAIDSIGFETKYIDLTKMPRINDARSREYLIANILIPIAFRDRRLILNSQAHLESIFSKSPRWPYVLAFARRDHVGSAAGTQDAMEWPLRSAFYQRMSHGPRRVLVYQNTTDGLGDELIRTDWLLQSLLVLNPEIKIVFYTRRPFLVSHDNVEIVEIRKDNPALREIDRTTPFDLVVQATDFSKKLAVGNRMFGSSIDALRKLNNPIFIRTHKDNADRFEVSVTIDGATYSPPSGEEFRNVYLPFLTVAMDLGLPLRVGTEQVNQDQSLLIARKDPKVAAIWNVQVARAQGRPVVLLNGFAGESERKGIPNTPEGQAQFVSYIKDLVSAKYFVVLTPNDQPYGSVEVLNNIIEKLPPSALDFVWIAPSPAKTGLSLKWWVAQSDAVITVEGGMMHLAYSLGKPLIAIESNDGSTTVKYWLSVAAGGNQKAMNPSRPLAQQIKHILNKTQVDQGSAGDLSQPVAQPGRPTSANPKVSQANEIFSYLEPLLFLVPELLIDLEADWKRALSERIELPQRAKNWDQVEQWLVMIKKVLDLREQFGMFVMHGNLVLDRVTGYAVIVASGNSSIGKSLVSSRLIDQPGRRFGFIGDDVILAFVDRTTRQLYVGPGLWTESAWYRNVKGEEIPFASNNDIQRQFYEAEALIHLKMNPVRITMAPQEGQHLESLDIYQLITDLVSDRTVPSDKNMLSGIYALGLAGITMWIPPAKELRDYEQIVDGIKAILPPTAPIVRKDLPEEAA